MDDRSRTKAILGSEFGHDSDIGADANSGAVTGPGGDSDKVPVEQRPIPR